jgi:hypothetical protein
MLAVRAGTAAFGVEVIGVPSLRIWGRAASAGQPITEETGSRDSFPKCEESPHVVRDYFPAGGRTGVDGFRRHLSRRVGVFDDVIMFDSA